MPLKKIKVLFISHYSTLHGANLSLANLIEGLACYSISSVVVFPYEGPAVDHFRELKIPVVIFPVAYWTATSKRKRIKRLLQNIRTACRMKHWLKVQPFDLIYTNSSVTPLGYLLSKITHLPHIWHIREFGIDYNLTPDWGWRIFRLLMKNSSQCIFVSKALQNYFFPASNRGIHVYNGVFSKDEVLQRKPFNLPRHRFRFGILGQMNPNKNQEQAIIAFRNLYEAYPDIELWVIGENRNAYGTYLNKLVGELKIQHRVTFWGYVFPPGDLIEQCDVMLMCSKWEAMGRVTVEAMSYAKPVIGLNNGGTSELITHEQDGLLYDGTTEDLVKKMKTFIENPNYTIKLGSNGFSKFLSCFTIERYASQVAQQIHGIINQRQPELEDSSNFIPVGSLPTVYAEQSKVFTQDL